MSWEPGDRAEVSWDDGGSWHANLRNTGGLKPQPRKYIDISEAPDRVREIYDIVISTTGTCISTALRPSSIPRSKSVYSLYPYLIH